MSTDQEGVGEGSYRLDELRGRASFRDDHISGDMEELPGTGSLGLHFVRGGRIGIDIAYELDDLHVGTWVDMSPTEARRLAESLHRYADEQEEA